MNRHDELSSYDPVEGDLFFPFYSNYLQYEDNYHPISEPHERLTQFYLAIQELVCAGKHALAFGVYQDLVTKKKYFYPNNYPCQEEVQDMMEDIISVMRSAGIFASSSDLLHQNV